MKKYILGFIVIAMVVGASAFVKSNEPAPNAVYYWYKVDANGTMPVGSQEFGGPQTITYANTNLPCTRGSNSECIRGFNTAQALPSSAQGNTSLLKQ